MSMRGIVMTQGSQCGPKDTVSTPPVPQPFNFLLRKCLPSIITSKHTQEHRVGNLGFIGQHSSDVAGV